MFSVAAFPRNQKYSKLSSMLRQTQAAQ